MTTELETLPRFEIRPLTEAEGGGYLVEFPDYPGCVADGETPEDAIREGRDALMSYQRTLAELGRAVPASGEVYGGQWRQRVRGPCMLPWLVVLNARAYRSICWLRRCWRRGSGVGRLKARVSE